MLSVSQINGGWLKANPIPPEYSLFLACGVNGTTCTTGDGSTSKVASAADLRLAAANAQLSAALPYGQFDRVPQAINPDPPKFACRDKL